MNEEIRLGRLTRDQGIELVKQYDDSCSDEYINSFCNYIGISTEQFWEKVFASLNHDLFEIKFDGSISPKFKVGVGF